MRGRRDHVTFALAFTRPATIARVFTRRVTIACVLTPLLLLVSCKDRNAAQQPAPATVGSAARAPKPPALAPTAPKPPALAPAAPPEVQPLTDADVAAMLPKLDGDVLIAPKTTADADQAHATWCIAGTSADGVATSLGKTMTDAGWTDLATRGDAKKAGVSGERGGYRLSYVVSASSAASCREPTHYMVSATLFRMR
jgi:hypothetical protein